MAGTISPRVVVGLDGSPPAYAAVELAAAEAVLRGVRLEIVVGSTAGHGDDGPEPAEAGRLAAEATERVSALWPGLVVSSVTARGDPVQRLVQASRGADLVVVGSSGRSGTAWEPGPVCTGVAAHAFCPTVVVPPDADLGAVLPILLGACAGPGEERAIEFAFEEAALRRVALRVVHVWAGMPRSALSCVDPFAYDMRAACVEEERLLAETLAGWADKFPDVTVDRQSRYEVDTSRELVRASRVAGMVVVGARRPGVPSVQLLGTVPRALMAQAACPVTVVPLTGRSA